METLKSFLPAFENMGAWGYWVVFLFSFTESLAILGTIIPGTTFVILAGFLSAHGYLDIVDLILFSFAGAVIGNSLSFYLGLRGSSLFTQRIHLFKPKHIRRGKAFFKKYGSLGIVLSRFIGPVRAVIPFVAGLSQMSQKSFLFWNIISGALWAVSMLLLGYFFGGILKEIDPWLHKMGLFSIVIIVFGVLSYWLYWKVVRKK